MSVDLCAYQGERGAFSELAAQQLLSVGAPLLPCRDFAGLFAAVTMGRARWGVVPVENTLAGAVVESQALLARHRVAVLKEMQLQIRHALIGPIGARLDNIRRASSHPVALRQCRRFFDVHPDIAAVAVHDTAGAVGLVVREARTDAAAIAGAHCAPIYGAEVLLNDVGDRAENYTRFLLIEAA